MASLPPPAPQPVPLPTVFAVAIKFVLDQEGPFSVDPQDRGNWTGGSVGKGLLRGSKFGISAAAHPLLDISTLTLDQARTIYHTDYWAKMACDGLPAALAVLAFDAAVNQGVFGATVMLQASLGVAQDGKIGPLTLAAAYRLSLVNTLTELCARRAVRYIQSPDIGRYGLGWMRRLFRVMALVVPLVPPPSPEIERAVNPSPAPLTV